MKEWAERESHEEFTSGPVPSATFVAAMVPRDVTLGVSFSYDTAAPLSVIYSFVNVPSLESDVENA